MDLLVSIAYTAAADQALDEPLPTGMGLRVPVPDLKKSVPVAPVNSLPRWSHPNIGISATPLVPTAHSLTPGPDGLCDFDEMDILEVGNSLLSKRLVFANLVLPSDASFDRGSH